MLRPIIHRFVERVFADRIIGYLFEGKDPERIRLHEYEHVAQTMGAPVAYGGRPIVALHRPLRINRGHFRRRLAILRQELERGGLTEALVRRVLEPQERLLLAITDGTDCEG